MPDLLSDEPRLLAPQQLVAPVLNKRRVLAAFGIVVAASSGIAVGPWTGQVALEAAPYVRADLASTLVTPIDPTDTAAMARARTHLDLSAPERQRLNALVADGKARLGLIAFFDDADPDGDTVQVSGAGFSRRVTLGRGLTTVVVPYAPGTPLDVTAVYDGGGTVTVAVMTRNGPTHLRRLMVGESVGVATP